jgi:hypothetical protein
MNKWQKLVQQEFLNNEEKVIRRLEVVYSRAAKDINDKIKNLELNIDGLIQKHVWMDDADPNKEKVKSQIQSKIYQKKYQQALQDQVEGILDQLQTSGYLTIADYLNECYTDSFIGSLFDLHGQKIPLMIPLDQTKMVRAVQLNSKISQGLYTRLGEDINQLKKKITAQISRSVANGSSYAETAVQLAGQTRIGKNNAMRIARTEGHRIQTTAAMDVMEQAKEKGADVVKQWDAALDGRTRASHRAVDGEIREVEEKFSNGLMYPGDPSGGAKEVINCRCALLQRARWALDEQELEHLKERANFWGLDKSDSFDDFEKKYLQSSVAKPKKEYLTKKKLEQKIADAEGQMVDLKQQIADVLDVDSYDDYLKDKDTIDGVFDGVEEAYLIYTNEEKMQLLKQKYGGLLKTKGSAADISKYSKLSGQVTDAYDALAAKGKYLSDFGSPDDVKLLWQQWKTMEPIQKQIHTLQAQIDDWEEKLDKKIVAAEMKKLKKEKILLQDELDNFDIKTYSGIWKSDVTTADWGKLNIDGKKKYYEGKFLTETDIDKMKLYKDYYNQLIELDDQGQKYFNIQQKIKKADADLLKLQNRGKIKSSVLDDFTQDRKDAALWFDKDHGGFSAADQYFDPPAKLIHKNATKQEKDGFYTYTYGSGGHNRPLAGFQKPWSKPGTGWEEEFYIGPKNVWIDFEGKGSQIRGLTTLIEKSVYDQDIWLQSGQNFSTIEGFLGIPYGSLSKMDDAALQQFVGRRNVVYNFLSTAVNEGGGSMFNGRPLKINFYAPRGTQMLYASDVGAFGKGENEMILQRGGTYEITKIYWGKDATDGNKDKIFVDMEIHPEVGYDLFQQDPSEWTGSTKNYHD